jgi:hypothetical protein
MKCYYFDVGTIEVNNDISRFWKALLTSKVIKNERSWTLPNSTLWIGDVSVFYNRECYDDLCSAIYSRRLGPARKLVLIKGTTGIGKTMFLQRLLVDIVERHKDIKSKFPTINYITRKAGGVETFRLRGDGNVTLADHDNVDYELSDSVDIEHPRGDILTLEVASDKDCNYNSFSKRVTEAMGNGFETFMPLCTLVELSAMCPLVTPAKCQFGYDVFGGSARNFKSVVYPSSPRQFAPIDCVSKAMTWFFDSEQISEQNWNSVLHRISAEMGKSPDQRYLVVNSLFRHRDGIGNSVWASKFMEFLASVIFDKKELSMHEEIKRIAGESGLGIMFENIAHSQLTCSDMDFDVKPLHKRNSKNVIRDAILMNFHIPVLHLRNIDDIGILLPEKYGLPITSNFPLVDAIIQPNILFQMTVSAENHKGTVDKLPAIRDQLLEKDPSKHMMIFVVPQRNLKTFKYQEDLDDILQYLLCPDPSVQNRKRKQKTNGKHQQHSVRDPVAEVTGPMAQMSVDGKINTKGSIKKAAAAASDMPPEPPVAAAVGSVAGASRKNAKKKGQKKIQQASDVEKTKVAPPLPADPSHGDNVPGSGNKQRKKKKSAAAESITTATVPMSPNSHQWSSKKRLITRKARP